MPSPDQERRERKNEVVKIIKENRAAMIGCNEGVVIRM